MIIARAPLRISLGGGGTDLPSYYSDNGGFILSAAIDKYVYIYVNRPQADNFLRIKYSQYEQVKKVDDIEHDLVRPALKLLDLDSSLEIVSMTDVPSGTGLGSSGSYLTALLTSLHEFKGEKVPTQSLAEKACHIEMNLAGHPVGKHDHYLAAFGGITCLDINEDGKVKVSSLDISTSTMEELQNSLLLYFTGISRSSRDILQDQKKDTEGKKSEVVDSLHKTKEIGYKVKKALEKGNLDTFGALLDQHWQNKKRRSEKISTNKVDHFYKIAKENGAIGGKLIGAGGGGFLMLYCPQGSKKEVRNALKDTALEEMAFDFDFDGSKVLVNF